MHAYGARMKRWTILLSAVLVIGGALLIWPQSSRVHELKLLPQNIHWGYYDAAVKPVLRVASGDTIRVETMVAGGLGRLRQIQPRGGSPRGFGGLVKTSPPPSDLRSE